LPSSSVGRNRIALPRDIRNQDDVSSEKTVPIRMVVVVVVVAVVVNNHQWLMIYHLRHVFFYFFFPFPGSLFMFLSIASFLGLRIESRVLRGEGKRSRSLRCSGERDRGIGVDFSIGAFICRRCSSLMHSRSWNRCKMHYRNRHPF